MTLRALRHLLVELWIAAALVALWWFASANSTSLFFPPLREIIDTFQEVWIFERLGTDVVPTIRSLLLGLLISTAVGLTLGVCLGFAHGLRRVLNPLLQFAWAVPKLAVLPIFIVLWGIGPGMQLAFITVGTLWPVLLGTIAGIEAVDREVVDTARSFQLPRLLQLTHVYLPAAAPQIVAGARTSLQLGTSLVVLGEMVASTQGVGFFILESQLSFDIPSMWSGVVLLGLIGYLLNVSFRALERYLLAWHYRRGKAAT